MKNFLTALAGTLLTIVPLFAQTPTLTHVFDIRAEIGEAINGGMNPHGVRVPIPITGGTVEGKVN